MPVTRTLDVPGAVLTYDIHGPLPTADGRPALVVIAHPMTAAGFGALIGQLPDRTVVTYDPRGLGRSSRSDGRRDHDPEQQAADVHAVIAALEAGPVELFASSGGAVTALALVAAYPDDVATLVAHEPPLFGLLPDAERAFAAERAVQDAYRAGGFGSGMAAFIGLTSWPGEFTAEYADRPLPDPAAFGMPTDDDGSRDDPLLSGGSNAVTSYRPDVPVLRAAPTRVVLAAGVESRNTATWRTAQAAADALGEPLSVFPSHHGGFAGPEFGYPGQPEEFAARLREVLAGAR
ncbi:MAG TPA: alpha/beta hydrolase [Nakamurella sp.]